MAGFGSRGHEQFLSKEDVTTRSNGLIGSSVSAFRKLPAMHAPALDKQMNAVAGLNSTTFPNRLGGAGIVAEDSRLHTSVSLTLGRRQPGGRQALSQPQVPNGAQHWCPTVLGVQQEELNMLMQFQKEAEESEALLFRNLDITKRRNEQLQRVLNKISNGKETKARLSQERQVFPNVVHARGDTAWQEEMALLTEKHNKIVSKMQQTHQESEALLTQTHDRIVREMRNSLEERKNEMQQMQKGHTAKALKHEKKFLRTINRYNGAKELEKTNTEKMHAEATRNMKEQLESQRSQLATMQKDHEEDKGAMNAQLESLESQLAEAKQTVATIFEKDSKLLALQSQLAELQKDKVQLQKAADELSDRQKSEIKSKTDKLSIGLFWEVAEKVLTLTEDVRVCKSVNFASRYKTLLSTREENDVNKMMSFAHAALDEATKNWQKAQDGLEKLKLSCPKHLVDTIMERTEPAVKTEAPPRDIPNDTVNVECNANDSENERMEEQPLKKLKRELATLAELEERPSSSPLPRTKLPRKSMRPERIVAGP